MAPDDLEALLVLLLVGMLFTSLLWFIPDRFGGTD
jgi:hypothetical protein